MIRWYAAYTQPRNEALAMEHLARQGFDVYCPRYQKRRSHAGRIDLVTAPLFPRYVFVAIDSAAQRWHAINSTVGVSSLVTAGGTPCAVTSKVISELKRREDPRGFLSLEPAFARLAPGTPVRVTAGAFEACRGLFEALKDEDRVAILLDLLGRKVRVVIEMSTVEAA